MILVQDYQLILTLIIYIKLQYLPNPKENQLNHRSTIQG